MMYRQMELVLGIFIALCGGVSLFFSIRERRNMPYSQWNILLGVGLVGTGTVMIFGAATERDMDLTRGTFLAMILLATLMQLVKQRATK
jgi:drug/metabolite transporter (DMT)-like permease